MTISRFHLFPALVFAWIPVATSAAPQGWDDAEKQFLASVGANTTKIDEGVYAVQLSNGDVVRYGFGPGALAHDLARLEARLKRLESAKAAPTTANQGNREYVDALRKAVSRLREFAQTKEAIEGHACVWDYRLEGTFVPQIVGGTTIADAYVVQDQFGPPPPPTELQAYAEALSFGGGQEYYDSDSDTETSPSPANAHAETTCGAVFNCTYWEVLAWVTVPGCGYRSYNPHGDL